jgi:hypothetical protein
MSAPLQAETFLNGKVQLLRGDCMDVLPTLAENSVDSVVTDPPAGISFMNSAWDSDKGGRDAWIDWMEAVARLALRAVKPGGHALVWAIPRTSHWTATAWENAGWRVRDRAAHIFGTGFPKSLDVSKALDRMAGAERELVGRKGGRYASPKQDFRGGKHHSGADTGRTAIFDAVTAPATDAAREWQGWGTALKPAMEDWWLFRKPLSESSVAANVLKWGCGAINVDGCRVGLSDGDDPRLGGNGTWGTGKMARNVYAGGYVGERVGSSPLGRWPANVILSDDEEVAAAFEAFGESKSAAGRRGNLSDIRGGKYIGSDTRIDGSDSVRGHSDTGTAARFFYTSKADDLSRLGSSHPTVKPLDLIQYLVRLITPPGGTVLDCFAGTGTTGEAAFREGMRAVLIEREPEYQQDIAKRMDLVMAGPDEKRHAIIKRKGKVEAAGPLFVGWEPAE